MAETRQASHNNASPGTAPGCHTVLRAPEKKPLTVNRTPPHAAAAGEVTVASTHQSAASPSSSKAACRSCTAIGLERAATAGAANSVQPGPRVVFLCAMAGPRSGSWPVSSRRVIPNRSRSVSSLECASFLTGPKSTLAPRATIALTVISRIGAGRKSVPTVRLTRCVVPSRRDERPRQRCGSCVGRPARKMAWDGEPGPRGPRTQTGGRWAGPEWRSRCL